MKKFKTYLSPPTIFDSVHEEVSDVLHSGFIAPHGPKLNTFESAVNNLFPEVEINALALNSGTSALHLGLLSLGVGKGDYVICSSLTFVACNNAIRYLGAIPVFIDSEKESWNMNPTLLEEAIIELKKRGIAPKAILAVHTFGNPYNVEEVHTISKRYEIPVMEDAAEALGSLYNQQECGQFGERGAFSFNGNKIISTGGGGMLLNKNIEQYNHSLYLATQARDSSVEYVHSKIGYNYRMSNVLAAIGCAMLPHLDKLVADRIRIFKEYRSELSDIIEFQRELPSARSNRWLSAGLCETNKQRDHLISSLSTNGIESRPVWRPMHMQPICSSTLSFVDGSSEDISNRGICLPSGYGLDTRPIIEILKNKIN